MVTKYFLHTARSPTRKACTVNWKHGRRLLDEASVAFRGSNGAISARVAGRRSSFTSGLEGDGGRWAEPQGCVT